MANCEKCGNEPGSPYTFLYGKVTAQSVSSTTTKVTSEITGGKRSSSVIGAWPSTAADRFAAFWSAW